MLDLFSNVIGFALQGIVHRPDSEFALQAVCEKPRHARRGAGGDLQIISGRGLDSGVAA
jgi:hypothetical protein